MSHVTEIALLSVTVLMLSIYIFASVGLAKKSQTIPDEVSNKIDSVSANMAETEFTKYEGDSNTGSDVLSALRKCRSIDYLTLTVTIKPTPTSTKDLFTGNLNVMTPNTETSAYYKDPTGQTDAFPNGIQNLPSSENYINPAAYFEGHIIRNENDVIIGLVFIQKEYVSVVTPAVGGAMQSAEQETEQATYTSTPEIVKAEAQNESYQSTTNQVSALDKLKQSTKIIFSDSENSSNTETVNYLNSVIGTIEKCLSELNDVSELVKNEKSEICDSEVLTGYRERLQKISDKLNSLEQEVSNSTLEKSLKTDAVSAIREVNAGVQKCIAVIDDMKKEVKKNFSNDSKWAVGYPIDSNVFVELKNGVLTFTGKGRVGNSMPWLQKKSQIVKVVFGDGVTPEKIDYWFSGCEKLVSVNCIPTSVKSANGTFEECPKLCGIIDCKSKNLAAASAFRNCNKKAEALQIVVPKDSLSQATLQSYAKISKNGNVYVEVK